MVSPPLRKSKSPRHRRGIGAIIGGSILAMILFTSVFIYFLVVMQTESEKSKNEAQAARFDEEKKTETYTVGPVTTTTDPGGAELLQVRVHNSGSLPLEARYVLVTSEDPPTRRETALGDILIGPDTSQRYLNPGETAQFLANVEGDVVVPDVVYKVDVISSRGNIISATYPTDSSTGAFNTGENVGTGVPVYLGMGGADGTVLQFRTLEAGAGIILTDPGDSGNGIGIAIDPDNILPDPRLIQQPQIQPILPNPFGKGASGIKAVWGAVIANPTEHPMSVRKLVISLYDPAQHGDSFCGTLSTVTPTDSNGVSSSAGTWSCVGGAGTYNVLEWKASGSPLSIPAYSGRTFVVQMGDPAPNPSNDSGDRSSLAVNYNVFTDYGQFTKVGYDTGIRAASGSHPVVNAFLSTTYESSSPNNVKGVITVLSNQTVTAIATIHNYQSGTTVDAGSSLIIDIPKSFSDVSVDNYSTGFSTPCDPVEFTDGSTQIKCSLTGTLTGTPKSIQFTMRAPTVSVTKQYLLHVLGDGTSESNRFTVGPVAENVIVVTPS